MAGGEGDFPGLSGAHTPPDPAIEPDPDRAAKIGSTRATVEAAMADLVAGGGRASEPEQAELMLDEMDETAALFSGPVRHVADMVKAARGRGRPKGSPNRNGFRDVLLRMGYRHPGLNLAAIANADPEQLARELLCERTDAMGYIIKANAELLPYFESRRPQQIELDERVRGIMIIGQMPGGEGGRDDSVIDLTDVQPDE
jgi:hypothetical protein